MNWGRKVLSDLPDGFALHRGMLSPGFDPTYAEVYAALGEDIKLAEQVELREGDRISELRASEGHWVGGIPDMPPVRPALYFPALSVPLGEEDEMMCPPSHVDYLRERLRAQDGLNLLIIGYSGIDKEVRRLLQESGNSVRSLLIVNGSREAAEVAVRRINESITFDVRDEMLSTEDFSAWAQSDQLSAYFASLE